MGQGARYYVYSTMGVYSSADRAKALGTPASTINSTGSSVEGPGTFYINNAVTNPSQYYPAIPIWFIPQGYTTGWSIGWVNDNQNAQAAVITSFPNFTIGNSFTVQFTDPRDDLRYVLYLKYGDVVIAQRTGISASPYTFSLTTAEQDALYAQCPNTSKPSVTLLLYSFVGTQHFGAISSKNATATVPSSMAPTFSTSVAEAVSDVSSKVGAYVQGKSKLLMKITNAVGQKSATISSYQITVQSTNYSSATATSGIIKTSGTVPIVFKVTDSRGLSTSKTTNITVLAYGPPKINSLTIERSTSGGTSDPLGIYLKVTLSASVSSLIVGGTQKNSMRRIVESRVKGVGSYTTTSNVLVSGIEYNSFYTVYGYATENVYDVNILVQDIFTSTIAVGVIPTGVIDQLWLTDQVIFGGFPEVLSEKYNIEAASKGIKSIGPVYAKGGFKYDQLTLTLTSGVTAGVDTPQAIRIGNIVHITGFVTPSATGAVKIATLPLGWRPLYAQQASGINLDTQAPYQMWVNTAGQIYLRATASKRHAMDCMFICAL